MVEFAYNNGKHPSIGYTPFELNCGYHPRVFYQEDVDPRSRSKAANDLTEELKNLMAACRKTYNTPKNCKNEPTIKELSVEVMLPVRRFGWTANISKPNTIGS